MKDLQDLLHKRLPEGIRPLFIENGNGLLNHVLCAGENQPGRPLAVLLHGFPELAFSWRRIMLPLVQAGYFVIAPDQRGYGLTIDKTHGDQIGPVPYQTPLDNYQMVNLARDVIGLVNALGRERVDLLAGHDFGSPVAAWCGLIRPDVFDRIALMSAPFGGAPALPNPAHRPSAPVIDIQALGRLTPARKHYQWYYSTEQANLDMLNASDGLHQFLRDYYHAKSADWPGNTPHPLEPHSAEALAEMPHYYIMGASQTMPQAVRDSRPDPAEVRENQWLPDEDLAVYAAMYKATGFQSSLQWYRCGTSTQFIRLHQLFGGRRIESPCCFIAGRQDWGIHQKPGDLARLESTVCADFRGTTLIDGAGHWVQQEQPAQVIEALLAFARAD